MGQPTKRDQRMRELLESILAEVAVIRRVMPVHELRITQVKERTGWDRLLAPALEEVDTVNAGMDAISAQVRAGLEAIKSKDDGAR
ncbi:MAG: hypothetical protein HUU11_16470 [Anaerolineales bacterium]|nr:hypothetical protein [Anaerolineales bacterium]